MDGLRKTSWLGFASALSLTVFTYLTFWWAPEDSVQGVIQRIFYPHVASAWVGMLAIMVVGFCSVALLVTRKMKWDAYAAASAQIGLLFTTGTLFMGMMWAKSQWGTYWDWDPRLTSYLVLWLLFLVYIALRSYLPDPGKKARFSAVLAIIATLDVPIVYFSIRWWRNLHPAPVINGGANSGLPHEMLFTLLFGVFTMTIFYIYLARMRAQVTRLEDQLKREAAL